jgi:hypothetical protein
LSRDQPFALDYFADMELPRAPAFFGQIASCPGKSAKRGFVLNVPGIHVLRLGSSVDGPALPQGKGFGPGGRSSSP